jgi:6-pyruvoyltetrahydropterin/6-carboxytetrahydropterin synthase
VRVSVTRECGWPMGHRLQAHGGRCRFPHGHSYVARVTVEVSQWPTPDGMVIDFADLDRAIKIVVDDWDHAFMVDRTDPLFEVLMELPSESRRVIAVVAPPTAENIAVWLQRGVQAALSPRFIVTRVEVFEGPKSAAEVVL